MRRIDCTFTAPLTNILQIEDLHGLVFYTEFQMYEQQTSLYHALI